jgi:TMEM175 potassium channel family protein
LDRTRLEAFSDGVFAVAITLLALDLAVAGPGNGSLLRQLGHHWPSFVAYLISFFTIGIIWVNHHALVGSIAVVDRTLLFLNLLLLAFVVAIPFATATMAAYLRDAGPNAHVAMAVYCAVFEAMSLGFVAIFEWSLHGERRHTPVPAAARRAARWRFSAGALVYLAAIAIAFVSPLASLIIVGLVAVYYVFEQTPAAARGDTAANGSAPPGA